MNEVEEFAYINSLYDLYKELLTDKQREIMDKYYIYNLSLGEISEEMKVSRAAISDTLKHSLDKLTEYEDKLGLYRKQKDIKRILESNHVNDSIIEEITEVF